MKISKEHKQLNNRIVVYEEEKNDGIIKSKIVIYKHSNELIPKGSKSVPIWILIVSLMFITFLVVILIAALALLFNTRRPGLHGEDCIRRSCETKLALKCLNSTCQCDLNKYYLKGCHEKKSIGAFCQNYGQQCKNGLLCFNGKCGCGKRLTWNGLKCIQKGTHGDDCNKIECDDSLMLACDINKKSCDCNSTIRFWSGISCVLKRGIDEKCFAHSECKTENELTCINGLCNCDIIHEYYDVSTSKCTSQKSKGSSCIQTIECLGDMLCLGGHCNCLNSSTHYFDETNLQCTPKTLNNTACSSNISCRSDLGLHCFSGLCECDSLTSFWDGNTCVPYKLFNETCSYQTQCKETQDTICSGGRCICNSTTQYFETTFNKCLSKLNESSICSQDAQCQGDMVCLSGRCFCLNTTTQYFSPFLLSCTLKSLFNSTCSSNLNCRTDLGLRCVLNQCLCDSTVQFWNGLSCVNYKIYNETCSSQPECSYNEETICLSGICTCNSTAHYFDSSATKCLSQVNESSPCSQDIQCLGNMVCLSGLCSCLNSSTHYFNQSSLTCTLKTLNNTFCLSNITCRTDLGLSCVSGSCQCDSVTHIWDGTTCIQFKLFNETCSTQLQCKSVQETICDGGLCVCNSTLRYFNSTVDKCVLQLNESSPCLQDIQCLGNMICLSGLCSCLNTSTHYFSHSSLSCALKTLNNTVCQSNNTCRTDLGLSCVSGRCQCNTITMIWNGTICILKPFCPSTWTFNSGYCYYISSSSDTRSLTGSKAYCSSQGGTLVNFYTSADWTFYRPVIDADEFHIGLEKISGKWLWTNGTLFYDPSISSTYQSSMWESGKPGGDPCGRFISSRVISDKSCADIKRFVCEKRQ